jgi:hypothetical protein
MPWARQGGGRRRLRNSEDVAVETAEFNHTHAMTAGISIDIDRICFNA